MMTDRKLVVLAYSGGLDTSIVLRWLVECGHRLICVDVNMGQGDNFTKVREKALSLGAEECLTPDVREEFVRDGLFWMMQAQALYEKHYIPCTAMARYFIMREVIKVAHEYGAGAIAHGATAKGNDQVRFAFTKYALDDSLELIAPWQMPEFYKIFPGRKEMIEYAEEHGMPITATKDKSFSTDSGIGYRTHESGVLEKIAPMPPPDDVFELMRPPWRMMQDPYSSGTQEIVIYFGKGFPVAIEGAGHESAVKILEIANARAQALGIGIADIVENRFLNDLKSHGVYEIPGMTLLYGAYQALQQICLTKQELHKSIRLSADYGEHIYEGWWYLQDKRQKRWDKWIKKTREKITGWVRLRLWRGGFLPVARSSPNSLYDEQKATMERDDSYDPSNVERTLRTLWEERKRREK